MVAISGKNDPARLWVRMADEFFADVLTASSWQARADTRPDGRYCRHI